MEQEKLSNNYDKKVCLLESEQQTSVLCTNKRFNICLIVDRLKKHFFYLFIAFSMKNNILRSIINLACLCNDCIFLYMFHRFHWLISTFNFNQQCFCFIKKKQHESENLFMTKIKISISNQLSSLEVYIRLLLIFSSPFSTQFSTLLTSFLSCLHTLSKMIFSLLVFHREI